jgi:chromosome segregation ATPase
LDIIAHTHFEHPVIGPIGLHVTLADSKYKDCGNAVERTLGFMLQNFVVSTAGDRNKLSSILRGKGIQNRHSITMMDNKPRYQINRIEGATVIEQMLVVDNDVVYNALVDTCRIDSVIVVDDEKHCNDRYAAYQQACVSCACMYSCSIHLCFITRYYRSI